MNLDTQGTVYTLAWYLWAAYYMRTILFCSLAAAMACRKKVDICSNYHYGHRFDIKFNPLKSQTTVFGGPAPTGFVLKSNEAHVPYVDKVKYLGFYIKSRTNCVDPSGALRKFFGCFNNIMAVLGYGRDDTLAVHLVKTYCLPILLYGCEIWSMSPSDRHKVDVA